MQENKPNILIVDDDPSLVRVVESSINKRTDKYDLHVAYNVKDAMLIAKRILPEVIVLDLCIENGNPESGLHLIPKFFEGNDTVKILVLTGMSDEQFGVRCVNAGASSYLLKPLDPTELFALVSNAVNSSRLLRHSKNGSDSARKVFEELGLATKSEAMLGVIDDIALASITDQPVLIFGETGVGKSYIANLIHRAGARSKGAFVRSQPTCGSQDLIMSEFFGHTKGAYTGATESRRGLIEQADNGTLFIDEIDQFSNEVQVALLHVLQSKEYSVLGNNQTKTSNFRLIAATNYPEHHLIEDKRMREDFYHRIAKLRIHLPPLRERREDIPDIAQSILQALVCGEKGNAMSFKQETLCWLASQPWKGNIRELESAIELGFLHAKRANRSQIWISDLSRSASIQIEQCDGTLSEQLRAFERSIASIEFAKQSENHSATARALGIDRKRLRKILTRSGVMQND
jgi:DNA-binding NtrC family response regulator